MLIAAILTVGEAGDRRAINYVMACRINGFDKNGFCTDKDTTYPQNISRFSFLPVFAITLKI